MSYVSKIEVIRLTEEIARLRADLDEAVGLLEKVTGSAEVLAKVMIGGAKHRKTIEGARAFLAKQEKADG